jgi:hypothetical protein
VKENGEPTFQVDCAAELGVDKRRVSGAVKLPYSLKDHGLVIIYRMVWRVVPCFHACKLWIITFARRGPHVTARTALMPFHSRGFTFGRHSPSQCSLPRRGGDKFSSAPGLH